MIATRYNDRPRCFVAALVFSVVYALAAFVCATPAVAQTVRDATNPEVAPGTTQVRPPIDIPTMHHQPFFFTVLAASSVGWIVGMVKGFDGSKDWLGKYWPKSPIWFLFITVALIYVVVGGYAGTGLYQPATFQAAIAAGLSWPVALGALVSKK